MILFSVFYFFLRRFLKKNVCICLIKNLRVMKVFRVYTNERSDRMFTNSLVVSVIVLAENEQQAKDIVLSRFKNSFVCNDNDLLIEVVNESILSVEYNSF